MLNYIKKEPKNLTSETPLLILLHGYGSNEQDLFSFAEELPEDFLIISAQAPYEMGYGAYAWFSINFDENNEKFYDLEEAQESVNKISSFIDEIQAKYKTNPNKTFLLGFSQGCILSYTLSLTIPNKVQYVVGLSGFINEALTNENIAKGITTEYYISHGTADQVIPVEWARKAPEFLTKHGLKNVYSEYPVGHGVAPQNFYSFKKWLEERL